MALEVVEPPVPGGLDVLDHPSKSFLESYGLDSLVIAAAATGTTKPDVAVDQEQEVDQHFDLISALSYRDFGI